MPVNNIEETVVVTIAKALQLAGTICEVVCFGDGARIFYSSGFLALDPRLALQRL